MLGTPQDRTGQNRTEPGNSDDIAIVSYEPSLAAAKQKRPWSWLKLLAILLLVTLSFALWFVFTARAVWIQPEPQGAAVAITGGVLKIKWRDHYMMRPGAYKLSAQHEGYYPLTKNFQVSRQNSQQIPLVMVKLPGTLRFEFSPALSEVIVQVGEQFQLTSLDGELQVPAGQYKLLITSPRFQPHESDLEVIGLGKTQIIPVQLKPNWADVSLSSVPPGADVYVQNVNIGQTPGVFEILAGEHDLSMRAQGFKRWFRTLNLSPEQKLEIHDVELIKADGTVAVSTEPRAAIAVNGQYKGMSPQTFKLPPGKRYTISASKVGYRKISKQVHVSSDEDISLDFSLDVLFGNVTIISTPSTAGIWSDGQRLGQSGERLTLAVKDSVLEVRAKGYAPRQLRVLPNPQKPQTVEITLVTLEQARETELQRKRKISTGDGQSLILMRPKPFTMGASRRVRGRRSNETLRQVNLKRPYYLATKEVTNAQFKAFLPGHSSGAMFKLSLQDAEHPVVNVSWQDAARYCNWLSQRDGLPPAYNENNGILRPVAGSSTGYRLPTEQEWAWAARFAGGRVVTLFPWGEGDQPPTEFGNFADELAEGMVSSVIRGYKDGFAATSPVGHYAVDAAGLYDIAGNVSEWTQDIYKVGDYAPGAGSESHVIRGSSWQHARITELRPTYRDFSDQGRSDLGFRIARDFE